MKKKIILGLLTIVCIVSLAGCGQKLSGTYSAKLSKDKNLFESDDFGIKFTKERKKTTEFEMLLQLNAYL